MDCKAGRRGPFAGGLLVVVVSVASHGCGDSAGLPTSGPSPSAPASPPVRTLRINGPAVLSVIGETSQLRATATFSDNSTRDVTSEATWRSLNPSVVNVSPTGLVTVAGYGASNVEATYRAGRASLPVFVTPPGTFFVRGRVREPGRGGLAGVRVFDPQSGRSTFTSGEGEFALGGLTNARLMFDIEAYESREADLPPNVESDVALQRVIRLTVGESVTPAQLAPHDMSYGVGGDQCQPCRLIRVVSPSAGTLRLRLAWSDPRVPLSVWANGQLFKGASSTELTADVPVGAGELVVYVGAIPAVTLADRVYLPFTLTASMP
ncbi:MAG TPA: Ig-like domain-containing protein [Vicinamibacterales bacterium]|nr:Ig-like domain-containing protein [Vicinamibacterales bacterium]